MDRVADWLRIFCDCAMHSRREFVVGIGNLVGLCLAWEQIVSVEPGTNSGCRISGCTLNVSSNQVTAAAAECGQAACATRLVCAE